MRIDVHNHAIPRPVVQLLRQDPIYRITMDGDHMSGGNHVDFTLTADFYDAEAKLADLQARGLQAAVVSASPTIFYYELPSEASAAIVEATNNGLAELASAAPEHLRWMAHVPMGQPDLAPDVLRKAVAAGAVGVEVASSIAGKRLDEPEFEQFLATAAELEVPVMVHPAYNEPHRGLDPFYFQNVIGNPLETTVTIERLICSGALDRHPRLRLLLLHGGGYFPFQAGRLRHAATVRPELSAAPRDPFAYREQLFVDTLTHDVDTLRFVAAKLGSEHVMVGTDAPFDMGNTRPAADVEAALDPADARKVLELNATALFGFGR